MAKKYIHLASFIFIASLAFLSCNIIQVSSKPNVILICLDAARADHLSCYGYARNTTPNVDTIAKNGLLFKNHFSQATSTVPSVSSIFFSRYFTLNTIEDDAYMWGIKKERPDTISLQFGPDQIFLTKVLSSHGYKTALFSDHHFFNNRSYFSNQFHRSFISFKNNEDIAKDREIKDNIVIPGIVSFIKKNKKNPVFVYWHILFPHSPYPSGVIYRGFAKDMDEGYLDIIRKEYNHRYGGFSKAFDEDEIKGLNTLYDSNLKYADYLVGELHKNLDSKNLLHNTMIIITADHGECIGEHNMLSHGGTNPWDSLLKVPLIIYYPKLTELGKTINEFTESIDIYPTILDICDIKMPEGKSFDGKSLLGCLNKKSSSREAVFGKGYIRTKKYKYFIDQNMLYDIEKDPEEKNNITQDIPGARKELIDMYNSAMMPHKKRYMKSVKDRPLDYSSYFMVTNFSIGPNESIETKSMQRDELMKFINTNRQSIDKSWLINRAAEQSGLCYLPGKAYKSPVELYANMLNGVYGIYAQVESAKEIKASVQDFGLKYRFDKNSPFQYPAKMDLFRMSGKKQFYYYFYLGQISVNDKRFYVELDFQLKDECIYIINHIKFVPEGIRNTEDENSIPEKNKEFKETINTLKSLGYL